MEQPENRLPELQDNLLSEAQAAILKQVAAGRGRVPTPFRIWIQSPELAGPLHELGTRLSKNTSLSKRERELAILLMARHWRAEYVFEVHTREAAEAGLSNAIIESIRAGLLPSLTDRREQLVYDLVRDFDHASPASDQSFQDALAALGHHGLAEVLVLCGYFTSVSLAMKLYQVSPPG